MKEEAENICGKSVVMELFLTVSALGRNVLHNDTTLNQD